MRRKINILIPGFLKRLDHYLLINYPALWATKVHYALFFIFIGYALMGLHLAVNPIQLHDVPEPWVYFGVLTIPAGLSFLWYAYQVSLFKVEKYSGRWNVAQSLRDQVVYFLVILLIAGGPVVYFNGQDHLIANRVTTSGLESDINALEIGDFFFPTHKYFFEPLNINPAGEVVFDGAYRHYYGGGYAGSGVNTITENELIEFHAVPKTRTKKLEIIKQYINVLEKYSGYRVPYTAQQVLASFESKKMLFILDDLGRVKYTAYQNINRVLEAKSPFNVTDLGGLILYLLVFTSCIWLFLLIFQQIGLKLFLLTVVVGFLSILTVGFSIAVLGGVLMYYTDELIVTIYFALLIFFIGVGYRRRTSPRYRNWKMIALSLSVLMLPFTFLLISLVNGSVASSGGVFALILLGQGVTALLWNLTVQHRFRQLAAQPTEN
ncbi:MAG: hypothetical protein AAGI38_04735 [Bacteroidota bacterium]